jgi:RTA1 like protein
MFPALDDSLHHWKYCPSWPAAIVFTTLFGLTTIAHIYQAWHYKKTFCWILIMGALWEFISAITRIRSIQDPHSKSIWQTSFVFLVLAPLWINAFDYMVLGRMIFYYLPDKQLAGIKGRKLAVYFVSADISYVTHLSPLTSFRKIDR